MEEVVGGSRGKGVVAGLEFSGKVSIIQKVTIALSFEGGGGNLGEEPSSKRNCLNISPEEEPPVLSEWRENIVREELER